MVTLNFLFHLFVCLGLRVGCEYPRCACEWRVSLPTESLTLYQEVVFSPFPVGVAVNMEEVEAA